MSHAIRKRRRGQVRERQKWLWFPDQKFRRDALRRNVFAAEKLFDGVGDGRARRPSSGFADRAVILKESFIEPLVASGVMGKGAIFIGITEHVRGVSLQERWFQVDQQTVVAGRARVANFS